MDNKGIEFQGLNLLSAVQLKDLQKEAPVIKPVEKASRSGLFADVNRDRTSGKAILSASDRIITYDDARRASKMMSDFLKDMPELESDWKYDRDHGVLVVVIKNRFTGKVIRQIPPEEILSGHVISGDVTAGGIISKTA